MELGYGSKTEELEKIREEIMTIAQYFKSKRDLIVLS